MKRVISKALKIVEKAANKYQPEHDIYYIVMGPHRDRMNEHPSHKNYCQNCIGDAVLEKKRQYYLDRRSEMGKIYEYEKSGFYRQPVYTWGKDGKAAGLVIKKIKSNEPKEKIIKHLQNKLSREYPAKIIFDYVYYSCGETDDFDYCESCGVIFEQGLLLSEQELEYWISLSNKELDESINEPRTAYQLNKILSDFYEEHKHAEMIFALAKRIVIG